MKVRERSNSSDATSNESNSSNITSNITSNESNTNHITSNSSGMKMISRSPTRTTRSPLLPRQERTRDIETPTRVMVTPSLPRGASSPPGSPSSLRKPSPSPSSSSPWTLSAWLLSPACKRRFWMVMVNVLYMIVLVSSLAGFGWARNVSRRSVVSSWSKPKADPAQALATAKDKTLAPHSANRPTFGGFGFYVIGDTPYSTREEKLLVQQIPSMTRSANGTSTPFEFIAHVGDIQRVERTQCKPSYYRFIEGILRTAPLPMFVLHGDNDWYDCEDKQGRFDLFTQIFGKFYTHWDVSSVGESKALGTPVFPSMRHDPDHEYMFSFYKEGVLFVTINLSNIAPTDPFYAPMMEKAGAWIRATFTRYFNDDDTTTQPRAVIVLGHANRSPATRPIFEYMSTFMVGERRSLPFLYVHGDGHSWDVNIKLRQQLAWPQMTDIQLDQLGLSDPLMVEVAATDADGNLIPLVEETGNQLVLGGGLIRFDRQRGDWNRHSKKRPTHPHRAEKQVEAEPE